MLHVPHWLPSAIEHTISAVKIALRLLRRAGEAIKNKLRNDGRVLARTAPTASVIRGSRIPLRWYQRPMARKLESEGHGIIRDGCYETWVDVTPPGVLLAMHARSRFGARSDWDSEY